MNFLLLLALSLLWGTSFLFIKIIIAEVPTFTLVAGRLGLAALILHSILRMQGIQLPQDQRQWKAYGVLGLFNIVIPYSLISWGEQHISSGLASLLIATVPIFTVFLAHFMTSDDRITFPKLLGIFLGFVGVGILFLPDLRAGDPESTWGQLAVVIAAFFYAVSTLFVRYRLREVPPLVLTAGQLTTAFVMILPVSLLVDQPFSLSPSSLVIASWVGLTVLGTVVAYLVYFTLLRRTSATFATMYTYILPINGILLGAAILKEPLTSLLFLSLALVLLGVSLVRS